MRVLLMVGCYRKDLDALPDSVTPVVAGALDRAVWEHESQDETEERWKLMRLAYERIPGSEYEWREVWVELDEAALREHFKLPAIPATVVAADNIERGGSDS